MSGSCGTIPSNLVIPPNEFLHRKADDSGWEGAYPTGSSGGITEAPIDGTPYSRQDAGWVSATGTSGGGGDVLWSIIQASQLVNEIKGWPPCVTSGSNLATLNLWWDVQGTPTTGPTVVPPLYEGITNTFSLALKITADAAGEGLYQRWTFADEPRVKSGRTLSALVAIWSVSAVSVTAKLINSDASETAAPAVTAAGWTIVEVPNHTLAGTYCDLQITADGAGTFYVVPLGVNIGARGVPLSPRPVKYVDIGTNAVVNNVDPGGADWTDVDLTAYTSNLCCAVQISAMYGAAAVSNNLDVRRNGDTKEADGSMVVARTVSVTATVLAFGVRYTILDDGQIFEYKTGVAAGVEEHVYFSIIGYYEWA
jgi:hypothetical protein